MVNRSIEQIGKCFDCFEKKAEFLYLKTSIFGIVESRLICAECAKIIRKEKFCK